MNDAEVLADAIRRFGLELTSEPQRLRAVLADLGMSDRSMSAVLGAVEDGVPGALQNRSQSAPPADLSARLADGLAARHALDPTMAAWAVSAWTHALEVAVGASPVDPVPADSEPPTFATQETVVATEPGSAGPPAPSGPPIPPPGPWGPGPSPMPPPPPGRKGRGGLIALVVVLGVVLLAAGGAGALVGWNYIQDQRTTTSTTEDETTTTTEDDVFTTTSGKATTATVTTETLTQQAKAKGYNSCAGDPGAFANQSGGVVCTGSVSPNTYGLYAFSSGTAMNAAYAKALGEISPRPTQTMCTFGPANGTWYDSNKVTQGRLLCAKAATFDPQVRVQAVWTDTRDNTLRFIYVADATTYEALFKKWQQVVDS